MSFRTHRVSDVTALFNTNAFWAYILSVLCSADMNERRWEVRKLLAVCIACAGVFAVVYGSTANGTTTPEPDTHSLPNTNPQKDAKLSIIISAPLILIGEVLALTASITYALYQVFYKRFAVLPISISSPPFPSPTTSPLHSIAYRALPRGEDEGDPSADEDDDLKSPSPQLPWALHPNFLTSLIGLTTLVLFWIPIPIFHNLSSSTTTVLPPDSKTWFYITLISITGLIFNGGFMVSFNFYLYLYIFDFNTTR